MQRGTKLYNVFNATLETATFIEENIAAGASRPTWLVRVPGEDRLHRVSKDFGYCLTELEAWQNEIANYEVAISQQEQSIREAEKVLAETKQALQRMKGTVATLTVVP